MNPCYKSRGYLSASAFIICVCVVCLSALVVIDSTRKICDGPLQSFGSCATSERCAASGCVSMSCYGALMCIPEVSESCYFGTMLIEPGMCPSYDTAWERHVKLFLSVVLIAVIGVYAIARIVARCRSRHDGLDALPFADDGFDDCPYCGGEGFEKGNTLKPCRQCAGQGSALPGTMNLFDGVPT